MPPCEAGPPHCVLRPIIEALYFTMNKKEAAKATSIVREAIFRIDPYCLLSSGGPEDELDSEILSITSQLQRCGSGRDVAYAITRVLNSSFSQSHKFEEFEQEGIKIYKALVENGLK